MFFLHFQFSQLKDTVKQKHITISIKKKNSQHSTLFSSKIDEGKKKQEVESFYRKKLSFCSLYLLFVHFSINSISPFDHKNYLHLEG